MNNVSDNNTTFYALELEDYAVGIFCTGHKVYFATIDEADEFMIHLEQEDRADPSVVKAFHDFKAGNLEAAYVCFGERRLMNPAKQLYQSEFTVNSKVFGLSDETGYPYDYQIAGGIIRHGIFNYNNEFYYAYKAELHDIQQYNPYHKHWVLFEDRFWGYPCMIERMVSDDHRHTITKSSMWLVEKIFDTEAKARNHLNHIESNPQAIGLTAFWEDVVGNG